MISAAFSANGQVSVVKLLKKKKGGIIVSINLSAAIVQFISIVLVVAFIYVIFLVIKTEEVTSYRVT
jgi:hypothetical protein